MIQDKLLCILAAISVCHAQSDDPAVVLSEANVAGAKLKTVKYSVSANMGKVSVHATVWQENSNTPDIGILGGRFRIKGAQETDGSTAFFDVAYDGKALRIRGDDDQTKTIEAPTGYLAGQNIPFGAMLAAIPITKHRFSQPAKSTLSFLADKKIGKWSCRIVEVKRTVNNPAVGDVHLVSRLALDKESHLLIQLDSAQGTSTITDLEINPTIGEGIFRMDTTNTPADPLGPFTAKLLPVGGHAPAFRLQMSNGKTYDSAKDAGKVIVLDFWATYCVPCQKMMPILESMYKKYNRDELTVIGISIDHEGDPVAMMKRMGHTYPIALHGDATAKAFKVQVLPTLYIIDRSGTIAFRTAGVPEHGPKKIPDVVATLLQKKS